MAQAISPGCELAEAIIYRGIIWPLLTPGIVCVKVYAFYTSDAAGNIALSVYHHVVISDILIRARNKTQ